MNIDCDVLVIGAGISGLTAAARLAKQGLRITVIEAASRPGGVIGSTCTDGALIECGPNSIVDNNAEIGELLEDVGVAGQRIEARAEASKRYIVRDGALVALPMSPPALLKTPVFSLRSKLRLLREPFVAPAPQGREESVSEFVQRRLGREFLDYAVEPFVAGIYAGNPDELSLRAAFPRLHQLEERYGSLIKGQVLGGRARESARGPNRGRSFSFRYGMQTLPDALARALGGDLTVGARATGIRRGNDGRLQVDVEHASSMLELGARAIVLAVPAYAAAALVRDFDADAANAMSAIPYAAVASVVFTYARSDVAHPLDGFGFLAPRVEQRRILGSLFSSSTFEGRAPRDAVLLTTFVGGRRNPELAREPDEAIVRAVREELASLIGATGTPRLSGINRWSRAIPQYTIGHAERIRRAAAAETALPGLFLCGSWRGGVSVGDCIKSAGETAERVAHFVLASAV